MKTKREHRLFVLSEFVEEQTYLMEMQRNGWKLKSYSIFGGYNFEECAKEEWVYELDYKVVINDFDDYLQLYKDCGWEYILEFNSFYYFRKKVTAEDYDRSIFSDDQSRYDLCNRILTRSVLCLIPVCLIFFVILIPNFISNFENDLATSDHTHLIVQGVLIAFYLFLFRILLKIILRLRKTMKTYSTKV